MLNTFITPDNSLFAQNKDNQIKAQIKRTRTGRQNSVALPVYTLVFSTKDIGGQKP